MPILYWKGSIFQTLSWFCSKKKVNVIGNPFIVPLNRREVFADWVEVVTQKEKNAHKKCECNDFAEQIIDNGRKILALKFI